MMHDEEDVVIVQKNDQTNEDIDEPSVLIQQECRICKDFVSTISDITLGCKCKYNHNR
jgi:coenzyme F420-reducing hydrogenase beta subunit